MLPMPSARTAGAATPLKRQDASTSRRWRTAARGRSRPPSAPSDWTPSRRRPPTTARASSGARYTSGDECYPAKVTVGDFMKVLEQPGVDPRARRLLHADRAGARAASASTRRTCGRSSTPTAISDVEILSPTSQNAYDGLGDAGQAVRPHRLARAALRRPAAEAAAASTGPTRSGAAMRKRSTRSRLADLCRTLEETPVEPGVQLQALRDSHGPQPRPLPQARRPRGRDASADRHRGRDLLPAEYLLEREPGAVPGRLRRRGVALRHRRVDLVHHLRALPQAEARRPHLDGRGARRLGAEARAEARRARPDGAVSTRISAAAKSRTSTRSWSAPGPTCRAKARSARWC